MADGDEHAAGLAARAALWAHFAARRAQRFIQLGVDALELAAFPDGFADLFTAESYARASFYRSEAHNSAGLFDWERAAVERHFPTEGTVLVTSAGGGREARALVDRGFQVVATECVGALAAELASSLAAHAHAGRGRALHLPPDAVPVELGPFAAAIIGWGAYTHLVGRARRVAFLRRLAASLVPGAPILLSYWKQPAHTRGTRLVAAIANAVRRPLGRRPVDVGETTAMGDWSRFFAPGDVAAELDEAGLELVFEEDRGYAHTLARARR